MLVDFHAKKALLRDLSKKKLFEHFLIIFHKNVWSESVF